MKPLTLILSLIITVWWSVPLPTNAQVNVTQEHNNLSRDGLYIDSAFTPSAAANVTRDLNFDGTISGNVYAQPLYVEGGPDGRAKVIVATESNNVYALDAIDRQRDLAAQRWSACQIQVCRAAILVRSVSLAHPLSILPPDHCFSMQ